ncbi:Sfh5p [Sugiyamaella lignohabitans]|uniref:Phosphatidylinositol transfer protein SFH5 n=1 Tax=Sugiyamaella lignohabitans TaxID=796027 RepID=A0A167EJS3_9ASCO|nr:Sfh5p [Sugiyamaella lignohabitans]ANB14159.1 Sfh5p [Sugiyamaella lignohabitans]
MSKNEVEKQLAYEKFRSALPEILSSAGYSELYGYDLAQLNQATDGDNVIILETLLRKFLQANNYEITESTNQLVKSLKWRKKFNPLSAAFLEKHSPELEKLGIVTSAVPKNSTDNLVTTWNLYGAVENREAVFRNLDAFLRWRVGLMEQGVSLLNFSKAGESSMTQVHDYFDVSFFRLDSSTKAATKATIELLQDHYPESLQAKYFVNVPTIMSWVFAFVKPFLSKETTSKFHVLASGKDLAEDLGDWVPKTYGGVGGDSLNTIRVKQFKPRDQSLVKSLTASTTESTEPTTTTSANPAPDAGTAVADNSKAPTGVSAVPSDGPSASTAAP